MEVELFDAKSNVFATAFHTVLF